MDRKPFQSIKSGVYMTNGRFYSRIRAILLTLLFCFSATGCAYIHKHYGEHCKSRAYTQTILIDYITSRYTLRSPVRMGIIPFTVPANISYRSADRPGMGNQLAWMIQAEMLRSGVVPIVEVLNRMDWPGKKEEFFTGNFIAIEMARDAGYDLAMVGYITPLTSMEALSAEVKIIDVESGMTVWYGQVSVTTWQKDMDWISSGLMLEPSDPSNVYAKDLFTKLARCIVDEALQEEKVMPE